jgi:hypothetical protein
MSKGTDFARQLLSDFFAARRGARQIETEKPRLSIQRTSNNRSTHVEASPSDNSNHAGLGSVEAAAIKRGFSLDPTRS